MSWDCSLVDPVTRETLETDKLHDIAGGTYCLGGMREMWLNVTYNYGRILRKVLFPPDGLNKLDGVSGADSIPILEAAISKLGNDVDKNYWEATEGNAKKALYGLLALAKLRPDGIWEIS